MTNDPEIRAAAVALLDAHVTLQRAAADLTKALPPEAVGDGVFLRLGDALSAESVALRKLVAHIEPSNIRAELLRTFAEALVGKR